MPKARVHSRSTDRATRSPQESTRVFYCFEFTHVDSPCPVGSRLKPVCANTVLLAPIRASPRRRLLGLRRLILPIFLFVLGRFVLRLLRRLRSRRGRWWRGVVCLTATVGAVWPITTPWRSVIDRRIRGHVCGRRDRWLRVVSLAATVRPVGAVTTTPWSSVVHRRIRRYVCSRRVRRPSITGLVPRLI